MAANEIGSIADSNDLLQYSDEFGIGFCQNGGRGCLFYFSVCNSNVSMQFSLRIQQQLKVGRDSGNGLAKAQKQYIFIFLINVINKSTFFRRKTMLLLRQKQRMRSQTKSFQNDVLQMQTYPTYICINIALTFNTRLTNIT